MSDRKSSQLAGVHIFEHLAAKEPNIFSGVNRELRRAEGGKIRIVAQCLLCECLIVCNMIALKTF